MRSFIGKRKKRNFNSTRGQGMVEFALAFPIFLMILIGIFESGRLLLIYTTSTSASRSAARAGTAVGNGDSGVPHYLDCAGIRQKAMDIGVLSGIETADISISYLIPDVALPALCGSVSETDLVFGSRIQVIVVGHFQPVAYFSDIFPEFDIVSESRRTILKGVQFGD
ncbi:MAG: pilus assembly protein [Candidatus Heimdallarchaeota archaeon]|nr:pilus assembly protein [Candidatus Heimdallarchaeota archaeon]